MLKKIVAGTIISFFLIFFLILGAVSLVNYNSVAKNFANHAGISAKNIGKITYVKFPFPHLIIDSIKETENLELNQIKVHFSLWSLLRFKPKISSLTILDAKFYSNYENSNIYDYGDLLNTFFKFNLQEISLNITNLNIINKQDYSILNFTDCSLDKKNSLSSDNIFKAASSTIGKISGLIKKDDTIVQLALNIDNINYDLKLSQIYKNFVLDSGSGEYKIKNLASAMYDILPDLNHIFNKFIQNEVINIKFNILNTEDSIKLENIIVDSSFMNGSGFINIANSDKTPSIINLHFPKIDLNSAFTTSSTPELNNIPSNLRFIFENKQLQTNISINEVILANNESLDKIVFTSNLIDGTLKLGEFSGNIRSGGKFKLAGNVTQNSVRSMFDGNILLEHNNLNSILDILGFHDATVPEPINFTLSSDLKLTLIDLYFKNLLLKTDDLNLAGNFSIKFIASTPHVNAVLNLSSLDLTNNSYPIISPIIEFAKGLTENMQNRDYFNKFIPIRTVNCLANLDITVNGVNLNNHLFQNVNLFANISPGNVQINSLNLKTGSNYLLTNWNLDASGVLPTLTVEFKDGDLQADILSPYTLLKVRNTLVNNYNLDKASLIIHGQLSKLLQNNVLLENVKFYVANNKNLFNLSNIEANLLAGKFQGAGNILLAPYSINFVYALNNIDLTKFSAILPNVFPQLDGEGSINGDFSTNGNSIQAQLYNLATKSQFAINNIDINNFSIDSFVEKINSPDYNTQNLEKDINSAMTTGQTKISGVSGSITLQKGIALLQNMRFNTKNSSGTTSIAVNIYNFDMDGSAILAFYVPTDLANSKTQNADQVKDTNALTNIDININGNIFAPKKTFDISKLKNFIQKEKTESLTTTSTIP